MPNPLPAPGPDDLDPEVTELIRRKARAMARRGWIAPADVDDVRQDLTVAVLAARARYDPARGDPGAWAAAVVRRAGAKLVRARYAAKRDPRRVTSLSAPAPAPPDPPDPTARADLDRADLRVDLGQFLARLPPPLRAAADHLRADDPTAAARALGVPRSTLVDRVRALRRRFEAAGLAEYFPGSSVIPPADG